MSQEFLFFKPGTSKEDLRRLEKVADNAIENSSSTENTLDVIKNYIDNLMADLYLCEAKIGIHESASVYQDNIEQDGDRLISSFEKDSNTFTKFLNKEIELSTPEKYYIQKRLTEASERGKKLADEINLNKKFINEEQYKILIKEKEKLDEKINQLMLLVV